MQTRGQEPVKVIRRRNRHTKEAESMPRKHGQQSICRQETSPNAKPSIRREKKAHSSNRKQKDHNGRKAQDGKSRQKLTLKALMAF